MRVKQRQIGGQEIGHYPLLVANAFGLPDCWYCISPIRV